MVRIFCFDITQLDTAQWDLLYEKASPERKTRADAYLRPEDRNRCLAAGVLLEYALGTTEYTVEKNAHGKPRIAGWGDFHYNLSHAGNWVVLAYGREEVGIDIAQVLWDDGKIRLARRFFTENEQAYIFQTEENQATRFFEIWTGKESYLKYLGTGLTKALDSFDVLELTNPPCRRISFAEGYCISLCTQEEAYALTALTKEQLL